MLTDFLTNLPKDHAARLKWERLTQAETKLLSFDFVAAFLTGRSLEFEGYGIQTLSDGREISVIQVRIGNAHFSLAIPRYQDGVLILVDFHVDPLQINSVFCAPC